MLSINKSGNSSTLLYLINYTDPQKIVDDAKKDKRWEQLSLLDEFPEVTDAEHIDDEVKNYNWWK